MWGSVGPGRGEQGREGQKTVLVTFRGKAVCLHVLPKSTLQPKQKYHLRSSFCQGHYLFFMYAETSILSFSGLFVQNLH